jgi:hypothetical protein
MEQSYRNGVSTFKSKLFTGGNLGHEVVFLFLWTRRASFGSDLLDGLAKGGRGNTRGARGGLILLGLSHYFLDAFFLLFCEDVLVLRRATGWTTRTKLFAEFSVIPTLVVEIDGINCETCRDSDGGDSQIAGGPVVHGGCRVQQPVISFAGFFRMIT